MKPRYPFFAQNRSSRRGMALILVLAALAFISILTVTFLLSVNHELVSSKSYASGASSRVYADAAVNLVIGQLQAGTTQDDPTKTWVSQPGLIRTFDNSTGGKMLNAYKLYSSARMVEGSSFAPLTNLVDGDNIRYPADVPLWDETTTAPNLPWVKAPNVYADLNSPITVNAVTKYPVLNPGGLAAATKIDGFSVSSMVSKSSALANQIPMPVTWLYILTDGRIATPSATPGDSTSVTLTTPDGQPVAGSNPPVARIAYWTDDNTCRLNMNTASEGSFWTMAFDEVTGDLSLSRAQVNANEYQRYPGHPASTSLSPVFSFLTNGVAGATNTDLPNFIYALSPRISGRGSQRGSRNIGYTMPVIPDNDRLYGSIDELLFLPKVDISTGKRFSSTSVNMQTYAATSMDWKYSGNDKSMAGNTYTFGGGLSLDPNRLEYLRFFLTTDSRSPEINLFGQPRLSLWPIDTRSDYQSPSDRVLSFASTLGGKAYYFQRQNPNSMTDDYNLIDRNKKLLSYLDHSTSSDVPGFGGNFSTKYGTGSTSDRAQILTSMFDWIRTVNLAYPDMSGAIKSYAWTTNSTPMSAALIPPALPGSGQVLPIRINSTQGYGRFPTLSKAAIGLVRESEVADQPSAGRTTVNYRAVLLMETYVPEMGYAAYVPDYHIQVSGLEGSAAFTFVTDTPTTVATPKTQSFSFPAGDIRVTAPCNFEAFTGRAWGGTQGFNNLFLYSDSANKYQLTARTLGGSDPQTGYPFVSGTLSVDYPTADKNKIRVGVTTTATATIKFYDASDTQQVATFTTPFSSFGQLYGSFLGNTNSIALVKSDGTADTNSTPDVAATLATRLSQMVETSKLTSGANQSWAYSKNAIGPVDVVRGVELNHGDLRLSAIQGTDATSAFVTNRNYTTTTFPHAHSLLRSGGDCNGFYYGYTNSPYDGSSGSIRVYPRGTLVPGNGAPDGNTSEFQDQTSSKMTTVTNVPGFAASPGDYSTGLGTEGDGPHIMKADEGNSSFMGMPWGSSAPYPYQNPFFPFDANLAAAFSPNRQVASAVQFGTLPSQPKTPVPWQTLLFRPDFTGTHPGAKSPADSLLLDLFWMPVTDPYPISEQFSTAGKVNMNYQIVPFTYITRSTAMMGALKATKVPAITANTVGAFGKGMGNSYKQGAWDQTKDGKGIAISNLYDVDPAKTLLFFEDRFANADPAKPSIFKSASEICSIPLAPAQNGGSLFNTGFPAPYAQPGYASANTEFNVYGAADAASLRTVISNFWLKNTLTGDNLLEAPYNALYPRLTTQSNTYTVYVRAQALQVTGPSANGVFTRIQDRVSGEYRGSYEVERYLDINDSTIPAFADSASYAKTIYPYYKFRILSNKQFIP